MFTFSGRDSTDGMKRRDFLRLGALGLGGLTLADLLRSDAKAGENARPKSIIYVVLNGGPSHIDMYDLKPDAPAEYRGPFSPIATRLPGVRICELMPLQAQIMDRVALLRGIRSVENDHYLSEVYSGLPRRAGRRPAFGSIVSRQVGSGSSLPAYVSLNQPSTDEFEYEKPYYAGSGHGPFRPFGEALADLTPVNSLEQLAGPPPTPRYLRLGPAHARSSRIGRRPRSLSGPGARHHHVVKSARRFRSVQRTGRSAGKLRPRQVSAPDLRKTFCTIGTAKQFLLARRLVEAGVRVVTLAGRRLGPSQQPRPANIFFAWSTSCRRWTAASTHSSPTCANADSRMMCWSWSLASSAGRRTSRSQARAANTGPTPAV